MKLSLILSAALGPFAVLAATLTATPTATPSYCPTQLPLVNPGFESGSLAPWYKTFYHPGIPQEHTSLKVITPGHPGAYKLRIAWTSFVFGIVNVTQAVDGLCAGNTYNVSFAFQFYDWYLPYHPNECRNHVELSGATALEPKPFGPFNNGTWYNFNRSFKADVSGTTNLTVTTRCAETSDDHNAPPGWAAWYDDFAITQVA